MRLVHNAWHRQTLHKVAWPTIFTTWRPSHAWHVSGSCSVVTHLSSLPVLPSPVRELGFSRASLYRMLPCIAIKSPSTFKADILSSNTSTARAICGGYDGWDQCERISNLSRTAQRQRAHDQSGNFPTRTQKVGRITQLLHCCCCTTSARETLRSVHRPRNNESLYTCLLKRHEAVT